MLNVNGDGDLYAKASRSLFKSNFYLHDENTQQTRRRRQLLQPYESQYWPGRESRRWLGLPHLLQGDFQARLERSESGKAAKGSWCAGELTGTANGGEGLSLGAGGQLPTAPFQFSLGK